MIPRVSVIMIFFNAERFIDEAITSVFDQRYDSWELLLVDDGSTDDSTGIARRYAEKHGDRVRYIEHEGHAHRGASAARTLGMAHARGEYIAFLDSDDIYLPHKIEEQVALLDRWDEVAMVYGRSLIWHSWSDSANAARDYYTPTAPRFDVLFAPPELFTLSLRDGDFYPTTCSTMIRRGVIDAVGGFEEQFRDTFEDMVLFSKILLHYPVYVASDCWDRYRRHSGSTWAAAKRSGEFRLGRPYPARERLLRWLEQYLIDQRMVGTDSWFVLQNELWAYRHPRLHWPVWAVRSAARAVRESATSTVKRLVPGPVRGAVRQRLERGWR